MDELQLRIQQQVLPPDRAIERIEATFGDTDVWIEGYYGNTMRLLAEVAINPGQRLANIVLSLTKGDRSVVDVPFGETGPLVGNSVLRAMLMDLGICVLRRQGVRTLTNRPFNDRLREHYTSIGFSNGVTLDLEDERSLSIAFDVIERTYARHGLALLDDG